MVASPSRRSQTTRRTSCEILATDEESFERGFLPTDYDQILFIQFQNCAQGKRTVSEYTEEFLRLQVRCNLAETEDQQVARYINGLNDSIQDRLMMQQIWSIDQAQALALKAERLARTREAGKLARADRKSVV